MSSEVNVVSFNFESAVFDHEGKSIVQLGTDNLSIEPLSFDIQIHFPYHFYRCMKYILSQIVNISYPFITEKYDYHVWKKNKIIQNLAETLQEDKNKPEHMKQDLRILEERRDNIAERIRRQLAQYDGNKDMLLKTAIMHQRSFNQFLPFYCSNYPDLFIIETLNDYKDYYIRFELSRRSLSYTELPKLGSAMVEFNHQFLDEFISRINIEDTSEQPSILLTSNKMKDKELVARSATALSRRRIRLSEKLNHLFYIASITDHLFSTSETQFINSLELDKAGFFDLIQRVLQHSKSSDEVIIRTEYRKNIKSIYWKREGDDIVHGIPSKHNKSRRFKIKVQPFVEMQNIADIVDGIKFLFIDTHFPVMAILTVGLDRLIVVMNFVDKKYELKLFNSLLLSKIMEFNDDTFDELENFLINNRTGEIDEMEFTLKQDRQVIDSMLTKMASFGLIIRDKFSNKIRYRNPLSKKSQNLLHSSISDDQNVVELAARISNLIQAYLQMDLGDDDTRYYITGFSFQPEIVFDRGNEIISMNCNCRAYNVKKPCYHIFALHTAVIRGGYYE